MADLILFPCPADLDTSPRCFCMRVAKAGGGLYISRSPRHQFMCATQLVVCTAAIAAQFAEKTGVPYAAAVNLGCGWISQGIYLMENQE